jgi:hypothetical protein
MSTRRKLHDGLIPSWQFSSGKIPSESLLTPVDIFALDLLHSELRLKRCEEENVVGTDFDSDGSFLSILLPYLLSSINDLEKNVPTDTKSQKFWLGLKVRCTWLVANFYLWCGKISTNAMESRLAEKEGFKFIDQTIDCLEHPDSDPIKKVWTPHLISRKRKEDYWKEISQTSLSIFRREIQAMSVVHRAQEQFLEVVSKCDENSSLGNENMETLQSIGQMLLERYDTPAGLPSSNHVELVDNFLSVHGSFLSTKAMQYCQTSEKSDLWELFQGSVCFGASNPSILAMLLHCLQLQPEKSIDTIFLLTRLVSTVTKLVDCNSSFGKSVSVDKGQPGSDDNDASSEEEYSQPTKTTTKERLYAILIYSFIDRIKHILVEILDNAEQERYIGSVDFLSMIDDTFSLSLCWFAVTESSSDEEQSNGEDVEIICSLKNLMKAIASLVDNQSIEVVRKRYFRGMVELLASQRRSFAALTATKPTYKNRPYRLRLAKRSDMIAVVSCEIGILLSQQLFTVSSGRVESCILVSDLSKTCLATLVDNALCLWRVALGTDDPVDTTSNETMHLSAHLDRLVRDRIRVPLAITIIGLCGSAISTLPRLSFVDTSGEPGTTKQVSLSEFYDSDASPRCFTEDSESESEHPLNEDEDVMRVIMQSVHCMNSIVSQIPETDYTGHAFLKDYLSPNGPLLPLIMVRNLASEFLVSCSGCLCSLLIFVASRVG